ncbi:MAG: efflux RND transporter periplasmic adaptor subunit [Rikenellaceae bacterium]|nr:efflux RND transporter periplasmic adaptor subunit [Rikenellaceae bacterium]
MRTSIIFKNAGLLAVLALMAGCGGGNNSAATEEVKLPVVKTTTAVIGTVDNKEEFTGTIQPYKYNKISPSIGGRIERIHVEVGARVRKGQLLVEMDKNQFLQSQAQLENLIADLNRYRNLYEEGGISKQQLDQMETQVNVAQHAIDNLEENTNLLSPVDGIVTERVYDPGDVYSDADGRILSVMQMDRVKVQVNISEVYFPHVYVGMPVEVTLDVYSGDVFAGNVSLIYPAIDAGTRTFVTEITIPNQDMRIRPGMFARVALNFGETEKVLVPDVAVGKQMGSNERYVFVIENGNVARRKVVDAGKIVGSNIEVNSGLSAGEQVVIAGIQKLLDGIEVEISK